MWLIEEVWPKAALPLVRDHPLAPLIEMVDEPTIDTLGSVEHTAFADLLGEKLQYVNKDALYRVICIRDTYVVLLHHGY